MRVLVVDALARLEGRRIVTVDVIGAGPRAVAGLLELFGLRCDILPVEVVLKNPKIMSDYGVLLVSAMTTDLGAAQRVAKLWSKYSEGPKIIGGPVACDPCQALRLGYDLAVYGEGEVVLPPLLEKGLSKGVLPDPQQIREVRGVTFSEDGKCVFTGKPRYAKRSELNYLHSTNLSGYELYWASRVYVEVVRGCSNFRRPFRGSKSTCLGCGICRDPKAPLSARLHCPAGIPAGCGYCNVPEVYGPARSRSAEVVVKEVKSLIRKGVVRIVLSAPDFLDYGRDYLVDPEPLTDPCRPSPNYAAIEELLQRIVDAVPEVETGEVSLMIENVKACLVDEKIAKILGRFLEGTPVHIGVESGDDKLLEEMGRPCTTDDVRRAVALLKKHGLKPYVYFMYAVPGETMESAKRTVELMEELYAIGIEKITAYRFRPLPGTAFEGFKTKVTPASKMIAEKAKEINERIKGKYVGSKFRAIVVGFHRAKGALVAYPLPHGPVTLVKGSESLIGWLVEVEVAGVATDRMLWGKVVRKLKRLRRRRLPG